jgi:light-regulated signal transduction histidine kinase (bacteriophytochrome)
MQTRTLKDKNIAVNLLNQVIEDLQRQKEEVNRANQILTEQKQLLEEQSRQLRESLERLEMSYEELEQFSYIASHDLRSPLRTIASYAQLLQRRYHNQLDDTADEFLNFITSGAHQMNDIISDLLAYSGIQDKKDQFTRVDLNEVLCQVRFNLHTEIEETQARIESDTLPADVLASKSGMLQLFQNLVGNAIKFKGKQQPEVQISAQQELNNWQFQIRDNGVGLDEAYNKKAFLPFQRMSDRSLPGSGIGLAICKKVVKLHGGDIWYESREEGGTTFYFTIALD